MHQSDRLPGIGSRSDRERDAGYFLPIPILFVEP